MTEIRTEEDRKQVLETITLLNLEKPWTVEIKPYRKKRTLSQNALMWKWIETVANHVSQHTGYTKAEVHEHFKAMFLPPKRVEIGGKVSEQRTTTKLTTKEMAQYMDAIYRWAAGELGLVLPIPEELHERAA